MDVTMIKAKKYLIAAANAIVEPFAMVVEVGCAPIAHPAMLRVVEDVCLTATAVELIRVLIKALLSQVAQPFLLNGAIGRI